MISNGIVLRLNFLFQRAETLCLSTVTILVACLWLHLLASESAAVSSSPADAKRR